MLSRLSIVFLLAPAELPAGAAILKGVILVNELSGQPMANVGVVADGANPTASEGLPLEFPRKKPGDPVTIIVKQEGYVVVNDVQLQLTLPASAEDKILTIIVCKEADREEMARRFNRMQEAQKEYAEALSIYEGLAEQNSERFSPDVTRIKKLLEDLHN